MADHALVISVAAGGYIDGPAPELDRTITAEEYADACTLFGELGLGGFFQQDESISESFIPAFDGTGLEEN